METYITREDNGLGVGSFDSIAWIFEKYGIADNKDIKYGVIHGNEDSPKMVCLWKEEPTYMQKADIILE
jgi:hypothetical protein